MRLPEVAPLLQNASETDISHIFYTSGTSGSPKGVKVLRKSLAAYVAGKIEASRLNQHSKVFSASAFTFDPNYGDAISCLAIGATLCGAPRECISGGRLTECLRAVSATHVCMTPTLWSMRGRPKLREIVRNDTDGAGETMAALNAADAGDAMIPKLLPCLEEVALGGEKMPEELISCARKHWNCGARRIRLVNTYGVTECTVYQTFAVLNDAHGLEAKVLQGLIGSSYKEVRIGLRVENGAILWLDSDKGELVEGHSGEIVISGAQVAQGYVSTRSESFFKADGIPAFATGDLATTCFSQTCGWSLSLLGK